MPDPYFGANSKQYSWVDEKVWYFKKIFTVGRNLDEVNAYLCFDGAAYYSRVWVNGVLLGEHEGMFGGPVCDIAAYLKPRGKNELIVEIKACDYGVKDTFNSRNNGDKNSQIVPWNPARDRVTCNGDFIVMGTDQGRPCADHAVGKLRARGIRRARQTVCHRVSQRTVGRNKIIKSRDPFSDHGFF